MICTYLLSWRVNFVHPKYGSKSICLLNCRGHSISDSTIPRWGKRGTGRCSSWSMQADVKFGTKLDMVKAVSFPLSKSKAKVVPTIKQPPPSSASSSQSFRHLSSKHIASHQTESIQTMAAQSSLPHRGTGMSDDAVPDTDPSDVRFP